MKNLLRIIVFLTYAIGSFYTAAFYYTNMNTVRFSVIFGIAINLLSAVAFIIGIIIEIFEWRKNTEAVFSHSANIIGKYIMTFVYGALAFMAINMAMFHFIKMENVGGICCGVISFFIAGIFGLILMFLELEKVDRRKRENKENIKI